MDIEVAPGTYIVAVSGGVDSMVLLDLLVKQADSWNSRSQQPTVINYQLVVAHFDHGIRPDSAIDRRLVQAAAEEYGLPFEYEEGRLGVGASEEAARLARYGFLEQVRQKYAARAIITAHHQDDVLETAILNILRGTGRKGLTSLGSGQLVVRPLLHVSKQALRDYALRYGIQWREDSTNTDETYLRNYIRRTIVPKFDDGARQKLLEIIGSARATNERLDEELQYVLQAQPGVRELERASFLGLPHAVAKELLAGWLREQGIRNFTGGTLERVTVAAKTQRPGAIIDIIGGFTMHVTKTSLALVDPER